MNRTKRGPTRPWSRRLLAEAVHLEALSKRWNTSGVLSLHACNQLTEAARHVRAAAEHQEKREAQR